MATIEIAGACKDYGGARVLHGVDLTIGDGEFVVLVGPSGCGKSTLLRMIAGLEEISDGTISIGGNVVNDRAPRDRDIAMVFQSYALYPHMTVAQNMGYSLRIQRSTRERIIDGVTEAARILGLGELLERRPRTLSGGQRQRVAMGRAIVRKPKAFLFDEPLSNLDARLREQMRAEIRKLHRDLGATSVYVTHDQIEAMTMGDRIVAMQSGVIQQIAAPEEIYERPANRFVAGFIGSPAMNFFPARYQRRGGEARVESAFGALSVTPRATLGDGVEVLVGARPENLALAAGHEASGEVEMIEYMGATALLHLVAGQEKLRLMSFGAPDLEPGAKVGFAAPADKIHLFDKNSERRLD